MKVLVDLFITFAKMGAVTFGGGYAMLPILQKTLVEDKKWATDEELLDYYAIGPVSYTHLDVYKRQKTGNGSFNGYNDRY